METRDLLGRLSNPVQRRLSATAVVDLVEAYLAGATISQLAVEFGIHRTAVTARIAAPLAEGSTIEFEALV